MSRILCIVSCAFTTLGASAMAQSISWMAMDVPTNVSAYLPKIAGDGNGYFVLVGQDRAGTGELLYETGGAVSEMPASSIDWNAAQNLAKGSGPAIAAATLFSQTWEAAVEVHQTTDDNGAALTSRVAVWPFADPPTAMPTTLAWSRGDQFDQGYEASVSLDILHSWEAEPNSTTVVEVHQSASGMSDLWYHVGTLLVHASTGTAKLTWGPGYQFDYGYAPSVSVCEGIAVEVHEGAGGTLWYSYGTVDTATNTISWSTSEQYDSGYRPSVAACGNIFNSRGHPFNPPNYYLVEVHQSNSPSSGATSPLLYQVSNYSASGVEWGTATNYDTGCYPAVSVLYGTSSSTAPTYVAEAHAVDCGGPSAVEYDLGTFAIPRK